jgi:glycosyltransferase involved in cell wall biosynthesis
MKKNMKITFVVPSTGVCGGVRVVFEYANRLIDRGHEVKIVYPIIPLRIVPRKKYKNLRDQIVGTLINIKSRSKVTWFDLKARVIGVPTLKTDYLKFVEKLVPDADIIIATAWETAYTVNKLPDRKGQKFYFVQHYEIWNVWDEDDCWDQARKLEEDSSKLCLAMQEILPKNTYLRKEKEIVDKTYTLPLRKITISSWLKELIENKFNGKVEGVIINGVNFATFYKEKKTKKNNNVVVSMAYRPSRWKGIADGIEAFKLVRERLPNTEFIMYGTKNRTDIPEWIKVHEKVLNDKELRENYNLSDIFVIPSWIEGCQLPPMEAMACGCAVVATNVGGVPDYAINGESILSCPPQSPKELAKLIIQLIENDAERNRIAENGYTHIKQFNWDKATDQLENIFLSSVNKYETT